MDKLVSLLVLLIYLTNEILVMLGLACFLSKGKVFFAIITMFGVHYYASKTTETLKKIFQDGE